VEGFAASLLQHEIDHLDGVLTLDRATPEERRRAIAVLLEQAA
jgi:peptide deformylase